MESNGKFTLIVDVYKRQVLDIHMGNYASGGR